MKKLLAFLSLLLLLTTAHGQGIPFIRNFSADEYHANNTNFDIDTDERGNVFVANFEGLLYYDYAEWRMIHTPGITRVTVVYRATDNNIWVGGYNYFGKVVRKDNGEITLQRIGKQDLFRGEVQEIFEIDGKLLFVVNNGFIYQVNNDKVSVLKEVDKKSLKMGMLDVVNVDALQKGESDLIKNDTVQIEPLGNGLNAIVLKNAGIVITDDKKRTIYTITDANGLCSNVVSYANYDGRGHLWGATNRGIFSVQIPSPITRFTPHEGLQGLVLSIASFNGIIYVGTDEGLFRQEGYRFTKVPGVNHACLEMKNSGNTLLAATADGIFRVYPDGHARQLTELNTMSLLDEGDKIYSGESDGVFLMRNDGQNRQKICNLENVKKIVKDKEGTIWVQSLYGAVWYKKVDDTMFRRYKTNKKTETLQTIVMTGDKVNIVCAEDTTPIPYPVVSYVDADGVTWLTNNEGKKLYRWKNGKRLSDLDQLLFCVNEIPVNAIFVRQNEIWLGSDNGLTIINPKMNIIAKENKPKLYIRSVKLGNDSILWGGFGEMPKSLPDLGHNDNSLSFTFSIDNPYLVGKTMYRYRLNNGDWSPWSNSTSANYPNLAFGNYTFDVQARDMLNRLSDISSISFYIRVPYYYRWYMNLFYLLFLSALVYLLFQLRLRRLEREKVRLEKIVTERSAEVVRLEKMATAGKLTQGLIDRILNPLNYINNFAKLSEGLVRDVKANVEDEKERMEEDNYEDTMEVLDMLKLNLQKVGEHGQNTARTLKAMEEMLKDRSGGIVPMDLMIVIRQDKQMLQDYYKKEITQYGIKTHFREEVGQVIINGNAEQLSKTIMSLLANAIYAVIRKAQQIETGGQDKKTGERYSPEVSLLVEQIDNVIQIKIRDNGTGIGENIIDKIFDPFFTTKTTAEAAGVGLYLSREIVQNHGGDIQVKSVKNEFSEFIITLPVKNA